MLAKIKMKNSSCRFERLQNYSGESAFSHLRGTFGEKLLHVNGQLFPFQFIQVCFRLFPVIIIEWIVIIGPILPIAVVNSLLFHGASVSGDRCGGERSTRLMQWGATGASEVANTIFRTMRGLRFYKLRILKNFRRTPTTAFRDIFGTLWNAVEEFWEDSWFPCKGAKSEMKRRTQHDHSSLQYYNSVLLSVSINDNHKFL